MQLSGELILLREKGVFSLEVTLKRRFLNPDLNFPEPAIEKAAFHQSDCVFQRLQIGLVGFLAESELSEGEPRQVDFGGVAALVTKLDGRITAISNTCTHRGGQLDGGSVENGCVTCPIHQSVFRLDDGSVVRGPATAPQPTYAVRVKDGQVELRG